MTDPVLFDLHDHGVGSLTLNRPPLNVFDLAMRDGFIEAVRAAAELDDVRVLVIRAEGRHFSAGADLREFGSALSIFEARRIRWDRDPWGPLWDLPIPTIASLHGYSVGAGFEFALLCDLRIAATDTMVGLPETKLGMLPSAGGTQSLTRVIGPSAAFPVIATASHLDASHARREGIVHEVVDDPDQRAFELAESLATLDPALLRAARRALHGAGDLTIAEGLRLERDLAETVRSASGLPHGRRGTTTGRREVP